MFIDKYMSKDVVTVGQDFGILEARELMVKHRIRHLPVVEADNTLIGIVSDRDMRSIMPSQLLATQEYEKEKGLIMDVKVRDVMTKNPVTISPMDTLEDALLLMQKMRVGAFPVVDSQKKLQGIVSIRDLMRTFINMLGIEEPGTLLCILAENKQGTMKKIVDAITEEKVSFGSILVARHWEEGKRAFFPYLLTNNVAPIKRKLRELGFTLLDPLEWCLDLTPKSEE